MRETQRALIERLLASGEPRIQEAFLDAVGELSDGVQIVRVEDALARGDIESAVRALNITDEAFEIVADAVRTSYNDAGRGTARWLTEGRSLGGGARAVIRFNARNLRAEAFLQERSSELITAIGNEQRGLARQALVRGLEAGRNPRSVALDIAGRIDRTSNRRAGGIVGLSPSFEGFVRNARAQLLSGDPAQLRAYLGREQRDQRSDRRILRAINNGERLTVAEVDSIVGRYSDRLLRLRAETIARTEALTSLQEARHEAYVQAIEAGQVRADAITKRWVTARDARVRDSHTGLHNESIGFNDVFRTSRGSALRFPLDRSLGADAGDIINCRCLAEYRISFSAGLT